MHQAGEMGYVTRGHSAVADTENWDPGKKFSPFVFRTADLFERTANFGILQACIIWAPNPWKM